MVERSNPYITPSAARRYKGNIDQTSSEVCGIKTGESNTRRDTTGRYSRRTLPNVRNTFDD